MGFPFSSLGVTILIPGVWNGEICVFCGQPDFRLDFRANSDEFLRYLGWLKPWFGVGGVVKITVSVEHGFYRFGIPFYVILEPKWTPNPMLMRLGSLIWSSWHCFCGMQIPCGF